MTRTYAIVGAYALLAILVVPIFPHFLSPNEITRWLLDAAIVDHHTIEVTAVMRRTGIWTEDLAVVGGRYYSNKAPGAAFVALPAYAATRGASMRTSWNAMRLLAATLPALLLALWFAAVAKRVRCADDRITAATAALLFGTPLFAYGLLLFAHALSAFTLFGAWALLFVWDRPCAAGALLGLAVLSEYPNAIAAAVLVLCAWRRFPRIAIGGFPFAIALGAYNYAAFGSVFSLSSAHEVEPSFREMAHSGFFGVGAPSPEYLLRLLLDPSKGLFVFSPVLLIAFAGLAAAWRALPHASFVALVATPLSIVLTFAGYPNWAGGWTVGARYLVAAVPFLCLLVAFAARTTIEPLLLGASIGATAVVTLVFPFVVPNYPAPWVSFAWPILRDGFVAPNLLHFVSRPLAIAVPFAIVLAALAIALPRRMIAVALAGIVLWFGAGFIAVAAHPFTAYTRDFVEEVYFGKPGLVRNPGLWVRARQTERLPPPKWPF